MSKDLQEKRRSEAELQARVNSQKQQIAGAIKVLESLTDELEKVLPDVESQKRDAKESAKGLDKSTLSTLKSMKQLPVELQNLFAVSDTLKSKKTDAWK